MKDSDERAKWTLKICVSMCMSAGFEQTHNLSQENKNCQAWPRLMITSSVLYVSQLMLLFTLAHGHGKKNETKKMFQKFRELNCYLKKGRSLNLTKFCYCSY